MHSSEATAVFLCAKVTVSMNVGERRHSNAHKCGEACKEVESAHLCWALPSQPGLSRGVSNTHDHDVFISTSTCDAHPASLLTGLCSGGVAGKDFP